jgi:hypothetical protein
MSYRISGLSFAPRLEICCFLPNSMHTLLNIIAAHEIKAKGSVLIIVFLQGRV